MLCYPRIIAMCDAVIMCVCMCVYVLYLCNVRVSLRRFSQRHPFVYHGMIASRLLSFLVSPRNYLISKNGALKNLTHTYTYLYICTKRRRRRGENYIIGFSPLFSIIPRLYRRSETIKKTLIIILKDHIVKNGSPAPKPNFLVPI